MCIRDRSEPGRLPVRSPGLAKELSVVFEVSQELEEVECLKGWSGFLRHIRKRLPGAIGHSTSSCFCMMRVRVRTNALIAE